MTHDQASKVILQAFRDAGHSTRTQIDADRIAIALDALGLLYFAARDDQPRFTNAPPCHPDGFWVNGTLTGQPVTSASSGVAVCSMCGQPATPAPDLMQKYIDDKGEKRLVDAKDIPA